VGNSGDAHVLPCSPMTPKSATSHGEDPCRPPNKPICFLGPLKNPVHISDGILIGTANSRDAQTDRQTDRHRYNGDNSPHLMLCIAYSDEIIILYEVLRTDDGSMYSLSPPQFSISLTGNPIEEKVMEK